MAHILSKSTFLYGCQCPKRLYLHKFRPELANPEEEESSFITGAEVGLLARELFPGGKSAEPPDPYSYHISVEKTKEYISKGEQVIYEAAFNYNGILCAIDVLVNMGSKWFAYEVKGSTKVKAEHVMDASFQHYVITNSGLPLEDISIAFLNNKYLRNGSLNVNELFNIESVLDQAREKGSFIAAKIDVLKSVIASNEEPQVSTGKQCYNPYECNFTRYCGLDIAVNTSQGEKYIDDAAIAEFLSDWKYPLHFFDFETIMPAIPEFNMSRPYQQIPFQYSLHIQIESSKLEHVEFLGDGLSDPRENLLNHFLDRIGTQGSIVVWNQTFEITRLKELAMDFPKYAGKIDNVLDRIVDLMTPFKKRWYKLPEFNGSASLKAVLPVMVPELTYSALAIQNGTSASSIYSRLRNQSTEIQTEQRKQLLEYCKLDTLAMVKIFEKIR